MDGFKLKVYNYVNGVLQIEIKLFEKLEDAIEHGLSIVCQKFKVHDKDGNVCHDSEGHHHHHHYA